MFRFLILLSLATCAFAKQPTPDEALAKLMEGNKRFAQGMKEGLNRTPQRRKETKEAQAPFAVIVACSDSRVPPEILFDTGLGELFVVRTAGNVIGKVDMESVNFGIEALGAPIVLIMGHQNCGAVEAVISGNDADIPQIAGLIQPAATKAKQEKAKNLLEAATKFNAENGAKQLMETPEVKKKVALRELDIRAAYYDFATGKVTLTEARELSQ